MATKSIVPHRELAALQAEATAADPHHTDLVAAGRGMARDMEQVILDTPSVEWTAAPPLDAGWYWWVNARRYVRPVRVFRSNGTLTVEYVGQDVPLATFHTSDTRWAGPLVVPDPPAEE